MCQRATLTVSLRHLKGFVVTIKLIEKIAKNMCFFGQDSGLVRNSLRVSLINHSLRTQYFNLNSLTCQPSVCKGLKTLGTHNLLSELGRSTFHKNNYKNVNGLFRKSLRNSLPSPNFGQQKYLFFAIFSMSLTVMTKPFRWRKETVDVDLWRTTSCC